MQGDNQVGVKLRWEAVRCGSDYFATGILVVWGVDGPRAHVVRVYRAANADQPTIYQRGQMAEAEPAVPGWRMPVDDRFPRI